MYICLLAYSIVSVLGVLAWWLSFDDLLPIAMGGIAGSIIPILLAIFHIGYLLYGSCKKDPIGEDHEKAAILLCITISASAIIGVMLTAGVAAIFPNPIAGFTLINAITGIIATTAGFFATIAMLNANKASVATSITEVTYVKVSEGEVDECITLPEEEVNKSITSTTVEKVPSAKETVI